MITKVSPKEARRKRRMSRQAAKREAALYRRRSQNGGNFKESSYIDASFLGKGYYVLYEAVLFKKNAPVRYGWVTEYLLPEHNTVTEAYELWLKTGPGGALFYVDHQEKTLVWIGSPDVSDLVWQGSPRYPKVYDMDFEQIDFMDTYDTWESWPLEDSCE